MSNITYVNGRYLSAKNAVVSVQDRGFRYGDGVFETLSVYQGIPYQWELHQARLEAGLKALEIPAPSEDLRAVCLRLLARNALSDASIRIAVSRGVGSRGYLPIGAATPTVVVEVQERLPVPSDSATLWLSATEKPSPKALPVEHKLAQGLNSTLVRMEAARHGCLDGLQLNGDGRIAETSSANIFWRIGDALHTPSLDCGILAGTTRAALLRTTIYRIVEGPFRLEELQKADAVILTNTNWLAMPISSLAPKGWEFPESTKLASEIRAVLQKDIEHYVASRNN